jgi:hypothetical protein
MLRFWLHRDAKATLRLYFVDGHFVKQAAVVGAQGVNTLTWSLFGNLPAAMYLIELRVDGVENHFVQIIKMR